MKKVIKKAFITTLPIFTGYIFLGIGFGILLQRGGYGILWAFFMGLFVYSGSLQYAAVGLLTGGASYLTVALTSLLINGRHIFYGISLIDKFKNVGKKKLYMMLGLTDETYALLVKDNSDVDKEQLPTFYFLVTLFDHTYWITGCVLGDLIGQLLPFDMTGVDFVLTALFITIVTDQWIKTKNHIPCILGALLSVVALLIFGSSNFLIPAMVMIATSLILLGKARKWEV